MMYECLCNRGKNAAITRTYYKTQIGKKAWFMKMWQMHNALITMVCYGIMTALMEVNAIKKQDEIFDNRIENRRSVMDNLAIELKSFGIFNKDQEAAASLVDQLEEQYNAQVGGGAGPDTIIVPKGTMQFVKQSQLFKQDYINTGIPQGTASPVVRNMFSGYTVYDSIGFKIGDFLPGRYNSLS